MTQYTRHLLRIERNATRMTLVVKTPTMLVFMVDAGTPHEVTYTHLFNAEGRCVEAHWTASPRR